jgi:hypothetical protein
VRLALVLVAGATWGLIIPDPGAPQLFIGAALIGLVAQITKVGRGGPFPHRIAPMQPASPATRSKGATT